jgi:small subunit ribosomal protein S1
MMTRFDRIKAKYKGPQIKISPEIESDVGFSYASFDEAVAAVDYSFNRNDVVRGTVVQYDRGGCIVDIGAKASAFLPLGEAALIQPGEGRNIESLIMIDDERNFEIISEEDENGQLMVSLRRIQYREAWEKIVAKQATDQAFDAECVSVNRGGAIFLVEGLRAFLPGSHLTGRLPDDDLVGQTLPLKFLEVNQEENKLVVSNRRAVVETQMEDLSRGDVIEGVVKALKPYGAFVEVGGMSGLLHISQISMDRIVDIERVLQPGQRVKCMIIDHDKVNGRIALSTKTLEPEPGDMMRDPDRVYAMAEETARVYLEKQEAERKKREASAKDIVLGLGDALDDLSVGMGGGDAGGDDASDNLDSLLN